VIVTGRSWSGARPSFLTMRATHQNSWTSSSVATPTGPP
jgi:hypothetical protein